VLEQDGSPPLYYLLLHVWMQLFGNTETRDPRCSLVFAVLCVPAAFWVGRSLWGRATGWAAAALAALNPFLTYYAQETRMYALAALLGLLLVGGPSCTLFAERDRRFLAPFAVLLALLLYTHNWAFFLTAGTVLALACPRPRGRPRAIAVRCPRRPDRLRGGGRRLPAVAADADLPGPPHRRAVGRGADDRGAAVRPRASSSAGATTAIAIMLVAGSGLAG
jgi:hypothetical protein